MLLYHWIATNTAGSYCLKNRQTYSKKSHNFYIICSKCPPQACTKISSVDKLKGCITNEWVHLNHAVIEHAVDQWPQRLHVCIRAGDGHFEHMMYKYRYLLHFNDFWSLDSNCQACSRSFSDLKCICKYCVQGSIFHFKFSKVVLAHILAKVGILCTILLSIYSGTCLPIFIEVCSYLTDTEQNKCRHVFWGIKIKETENWFCLTVSMYYVYSKQIQQINNTS